MKVTTRHLVSLDSDTAFELVGMARQYAKQHGFRMCIAVIDVIGELVAFSREDEAPLHSGEIAIDKAYTALSFSRATDTWQKRLGDGPLFLQHGLMNRERFAGFGGGFPLRLNGGQVGAIGVSGGSVAEDMQVAIAAMKAMGFDPAS